MLFYIACSILPRHLYANTRLPSFLFIALSLIIYGYAIKKTVQSNPICVVTPKKLPEPALKQVVIENIKLNIPEKVLNNWNPRCYGTDLPCLYTVNPRLRARGNGIKNGFYIEK